MGGRGAGNQHGLLPEFLTRSTLMVSAYSQIERLIVTGGLAPGEQFTEKSLALRLGMGTAPIREALLFLSGLGLVSARQGAGYRATPVTLGEARKTFGLLALLEGEAAAQAAERNAPQQAIDGLREVVTAFSSPPSEGLTQAGIEAEEAHRWMHFHLSAFSDNRPLILSLYPVLLESQRLHCLAARLGAVARPDFSAAGHEQILAAIQSAEPELARKAAIEHARASETCVLDALLGSDALLKANLGGA
jgi:DNA-binding GntR family transcriptional regulator